MPELRKDPLVDRWVIIATERARRPGNIVESSNNNFHDDTAKCPYCKEQKESLLTFHDIDVIPFANSYIKTEHEFQRTREGLHDVVSAHGVHEVVIETKEHIYNVADLDHASIKEILEVYKKRFLALAQKNHLKYVVAFKNYGLSAGSRGIKHARSHIIATPVLSLAAKEKLAGAKTYFEKNQRCVYCDLLQAELNYKKRVIYETDHFVALVPFAARFLFEVIILPKQHDCDYAHGISGKEEDLAKMLKTILAKFKVGLDDPDYNYSFQTAPFRNAFSSSKGWKTIKEDFHWHIELVPRMTHIAGFEKGTDFFINSIPPEKAAEFLREIGV